jgi:hypothetical protein
MKTNVARGPFFSSVFLSRSYRARDEKDHLIYLNIEALHWGKTRHQIENARFLDLDHQGRQKMHCSHKEQRRNGVSLMYTSHMRNCLSDVPTNNDLGAMGGSNKDEQRSPPVSETIAYLHQGLHTGLRKFVGGAQDYR